MNIDYKSQSISTPIKHNHSDSAPRANINVFDQYQLGPSTLSLKINTTTNMSHQKMYSLEK